MVMDAEAAHAIYPFGYALEHEPKDGMGNALVCSNNAAEVQCPDSLI